MSLLLLQQQLNKLRANNNDAITIDQTVIETDTNLKAPLHLDHLIQKQFMLSENFTVQVPNEIAPPISSELTFQGTAVFLTPVRSAYIPHPEEKSREITITFSLSGDSSDVDLLIECTDWTFSESFPLLPDYPFEELTLTQETLLFSSNQRSFPFQKESNQVENISLETGLNYVAFMQSGNIPDALNTVLSNISSKESFLMSGTVDASDITPFDKISTLETESSIVVCPQLNLTAAVAGTPNLPWAKLTFDAPKIAIRTEDTDEGSQRIAQYLEVATTINSKNLVLQAELHQYWDGIRFSLTPEDRSQSLVAKDILELTGGVQFFDSIPELFKKAFNSVGLRGIDTTFELSKGKLPALQSAEISIGATGESEILDNFIISDIVLLFELYDFKSKPNNVELTAEFSFYPEVFTDPFLLEIQHEVSPSTTYISGKYESAVTLDAITQYILGGNVLPENFPEMSFSDFSINLTKQSGAWQYRLSGTADLAYDLLILDQTLSATFNFYLSGSKEKKHAQLGGGIRLGNAHFNFSLALSKEHKEMQASWYQQGEPLGLNSLAHSLGFDDFSIPEELDLGLKAASFTYDFSKKVFSLTADSETWGKVTLSSVRDEQRKNQLIFFCHLPESKSIDGGILPLVGDELKDNLKLAEIQFLISTADFESISVDVLEESSTSTVELSNVKRGVTFISELTLGSDVQELTVPIYQPKATKKALDSEVTEEFTVAPEPSNLGGASRVGKSLGPFNFREFGVSLKDKKLTFQLDASLVTAGLEIHLNDLGLGFPPSDPTQISPSLSGLALRFTGGPLSIEGGLVHNIDAEVESYDGQLTIALKKLMISALGSYAKTEEGYPSLFTFAVIDYPLGGPPFFFVTGGALGFGYNRELIAPSIDGVREFPLIEAAFGNPAFDKGNDPAALARNLEQMLAVIPIKQGQNWFGLGVKFRSFSLIDGFALTTLSFGNHTEAHILGLATAQIPFTGKKPIAYIELALLASFIPDKGVVSIEGALTDRSFLFSENCKLTGGFAFYLWFDGEHAGDFVLTAGGYHPIFKIPDYYPNPQRIGVNWQITRQLSITGESYFALTSSAIMAGGMLNCQWKSGSLRAWFLMGFDFIIAWQPFYYDAAVYASIGVSARIKVLWVRKTVTVHVGANIHIWGPEFSGKVKIKLWFVSFTISFGAKEDRQIGPITWTEFKEACLPASDNIISTQISNGLIKDVSKETDVIDWIVDPSNLVLEINSLVPIKKAKFGATLEKTPTNFGVGMVRILSTDFTSDLNVVLTVQTKEGEETPLDSTDFIVEPITKSVPASMWKYDNSEDNTPDINDPLVKDVLTGLVIKPTTTSPDTTLPVDIKFLESSPTYVNRLEFGNPNIQPTTPLSQEGAMEKMVTSINSGGWSGDYREHILNPLAKWDKYLDITPNLSKTASKAETYWTSAPTLSELGYETSNNG